MDGWIGTSRKAVFLVCGLVAAACAPRREATSELPRQLHTIIGFDGPESVRYDPDQDVYFVSNMLGPGSVKDGYGYISRVDASSLARVETFIQSGKNGVRLDAPKGLALHGDTLWAADIDVLRGFDRHTGAPLATIDLRPAGAQMLNDVAIGPDGSIYVTDSGIRMTKIGVIPLGGDKIFAIGPNRSISVVARGTSLGEPNGITWDRTRNRWVVVSFNPLGSQVYTLRPGDTTRTVLARGSGKFDGVEILPDGRMLVTCWSDSSLHVFANGQDRRLIRYLWQPADLGVDTRRQRVAIPLSLQGRVEFYQLD